MGSYLHCYPSFFSILFYSVSRMQLPSLLSLVLLHTFLVPVDDSYPHCVTVIYWHNRKVWRRTRDNNEGNCRLLTLEKYGEERGITMRVTVVY
jgi:hypothetical protein